MIGVLNNPKKAPLFSIDERVDLIRAAVADLGSHVKVDAFDGLTVTFARRHEAGFIVRGLRAVSDFEAELQMALTNRKLAPEVDTTFLMTALEYGYLLGADQGGRTVRRRYRRRWSRPGCRRAADSNLASGLRPARV